MGERGHCCEPPSGDHRHLPLQALFEGSGAPPLQGARGKKGPDLPHFREQLPRRLRRRTDNVALRARPLSAKPCRRLFLTGWSLWRGKILGRGFSGGWPMRNPNPDAEDAELDERLWSLSEVLVARGSTSAGNPASAGQLAKSAA